MVRRKTTPRVKKQKISKLQIQQQLHSYLLLNAEIKATEEIEKALNQIISNEQATSLNYKNILDKEFSSIITQYDSLHNK